LDDPPHSVSAGDTGAERPSASQRTVEPLQAAIAMRHSCGRCLWMRAKVSIYLGWHALPATGIGEILEAHPQSLQRHIQLGRKLRGSTPVRRGPTSGVRLRSHRSPAGRLV
jgi:hypothetical protein